VRWPGRAHIPESFVNSALIATVSTLLSLVITLPSGFMLARYQTRLARTWFFVIYIVRTIPYITWLLPLFLLAQRLGLYGTYTGIIAAQAAFHVTFIVDLQGLLRGVPRELERRPSWTAAPAGRVHPRLRSPGHSGSSPRGSSAGSGAGTNS
jgi:multiple sugar transport system permease protein